MSVNVKDTLFHSFSSTCRPLGVESAYDDLFSILQIGILTRKSLKSVLTHEEYSRIKKRRCYQGNRCVSLAYNPTNKYYACKYPSKEHRGLLSSSAYDNFTLFGDITIIVNENILEEKKIVSNRPRMSHEVQIKGDIPTDYFVGIGLKEDRLYNNIIRFEKVYTDFNKVKENIWK